MNEEKLNNEIGNDQQQLKVSEYFLLTRSNTYKQDTSINNQRFYSFLSIIEY